MSTQYDIVIAGAGLAGLTLALELSKKSLFREQRILLLDRDSKKSNDRTWSFWATPDEDLPPIAYRTWKNCLFSVDQTDLQMDMGAYQYHTIRGIDFYNWVHRQLEQSPNVERLLCNIESIDPEKGLVRTDKGNFEGKHVFNSALTGKRVLPKDERFPSPFSANGRSIPNVFTQLLQHFKGWVIQTPEPVFDLNTVRFMDFRIEQGGSTRFVYVLPYSATEALVEYTVFSESLLSDEEYNDGLSGYIRNFLGIQDYEVKETEFGIIPMTDYHFGPIRHGRVWNIGTAAGFVKASSGYAFKRTQRKLKAFVAHWDATGQPREGQFKSPFRFQAYDSVLLRVLRDEPEMGKAVFSRLFSKLPAHLVLQFLDEDTRFIDELRIMQAPPIGKFISSTFKQAPVFMRLARRF